MWIRILLPLALLLGPLAARAADGPSAEELVELAFDNLYADDYIQVFQMSTRLGGGRALERTLQVTRLQSEKPGKALVRFLEPYDIRNTGVLILEDDTKADDTFVYLPALRMTRRLSAAQRGDAFFGSDLTYEDMEPKRIEDYDVALHDGGATGEGCVEVELQPRASAESNYDRLLACVAPDTGVIHWLDFYRQGQRTKRLESDLSTVKPIGERHIPFRVTVQKVDAKSSTRLDIQSYELMEEIPDSLFTTTNLQTGDAAGDRRRATKRSGNLQDAPALSRNTLDTHTRNAGKSPRAQ